MKTLVSRISGKAFRSASVLGLAALLFSGQAALAQNSEASQLAMQTEKPMKTKNTAAASGKLQAAVYPSNDPMKLKVNFINPGMEKIGISIKDAKGYPVFASNLGRTALYNGKFDLSALPDGNYTLEIHSKTGKHIQTFQLHTEMARLAVVQ